MPCVYVPCEHGWRKSLCSSRVGNNTFECKSPLPGLRMQLGRRHPTPNTTDLDGLRSSTPRWVRKEIQAIHQDQLGGRSTIGLVEILTGSGIPLIANTSCGHWISPWLSCALSNMEVMALPSLLIWLARSKGRDALGGCLSASWCCSWSIDACELCSFPASCLQPALAGSLPRRV